MAKYSRGNIRASKLTPMQVIEIRERYNAGATQRTLCQQFGVTIGTIGRIVRGETWQDYGGAGNHPGTTAQPVDERMHDEALQRLASANAPASDSAEIQASLARLAQLGVTSELPTASDVVGGPQDNRSGGGTKDD